MQYKDLVSVMAVKYTTGWFHYLAVTGAPQFLRATTAVRVVGKLLNVTIDAFDKLCRCNWIFQRNIVSNCIKVR